MPAIAAAVIFAIAFLLDVTGTATGAVFAPPACCPGLSAGLCTSWV
jgi:hypothetical protein